MNKNMLHEPKNDGIEKHADELECFTKLINEKFPTRINFVNPSTRSCFSIDWEEMEDDFTPIEINHDHYTNDLMIFFGGNFWKHKFSLTFPAKAFTIDFYFDDASVSFKFVGECEIDVPLFRRISEILGQSDYGFKLTITSDGMNYTYF